MAWLPNAEAHACQDVISFGPFRQIVLVRQCSRLRPRRNHVVCRALNKELDGRKPEGLSGAETGSARCL
jgi:hypothetical protein